MSSNTKYVLASLHAGPKNAKELYDDIGLMPLGVIYSTLQNLMERKLVVIDNPQTIEAIDARLEEVVRRIETLKMREKRRQSTYPPSVYRLADTEAKS